MANDIVVDVASREELGKNVSRRLRRAGSIPAVLYGDYKPAITLTVDPKEIKSILSSESGRNTLFQLRLDGKEKKTRHVMIRERQKDPVTGDLLHIDFLRIDTSKKVDVEIPVSLVGLAEGVKNEGGVLDFVGRTVHVYCLPTDIPEHFEVDVSSLHVGQVIRVSDLPTDERYEIRSELEMPLVLVSMAKAVEEETPAEGEVPAEDAEAIEEGGEAAAPAEGSPEEKS